MYGFRGDCSCGRGKRHFIFGTSCHTMLSTVVFLITINPAFTGYSWNQSSRDGMVNGLGLKTTPEYDNSTPVDVSVMLGQPVYLTCTVRYLGDKWVSWIRTKDLHILTSGKLTFTADSRFDVIPSTDADTWTLRIRTTKLNDTGKYECQVNTHPKMSKFFMLNVTETPLKDSPASPEAFAPAVKASISGPKEQHVKEGSTVTFECRLVIRLGFDKDKYHPRLASGIPAIQWLHNGYAVSFQSERGGISIETERSEKTGISRLTVASVGVEDTGKYTCIGDGVQGDSIYLDVFQGEHTEAMQRDQASSSEIKRCDIRFFILLYLICNCLLYRKLNMR